MYIYICLYIQYIEMSILNYYIQDDVVKLIFLHLDLGDCNDTPIFDAKMREHWMKFFQVIQTNTESSICIDSLRIYHSFKDKFARQYANKGVQLDELIQEWYRFGVLHRDVGMAVFIQYPLYGTMVDLYEFKNGTSTLSMYSCRYYSTEEHYKPIKSFRHVKILHGINDEPAKITRQQGGNVEKEWYNDGIFIKRM